VRDVDGVRFDEHFVEPCRVLTSRNGAVLHVLPLEDVIAGREVGRHLRPVDLAADAGAHPNAVDKEAEFVVGFRGNLPVEREFGVTSHRHGLLDRCRLAVADRLRLQVVAARGADVQVCLDAAEAVGLEEFLEGRQRVGFSVSVEDGHRVEDDDRLAVDRDHLPVEIDPLERAVQRRTGAAREFVDRAGDDLRGAPLVSDLHRVYVHGDGRRRVDDGGRSSGQKTVQALDGRVHRVIHREIGVRADADALETGDVGEILVVQFDAREEAVGAAVSDPHRLAVDRHRNDVALRVRRQVRGLDGGAGEFGRLRGDALHDDPVRDPLAVAKREFDGNADLAGLKKGAQIGEAAGENAAFDVLDGRVL